MKKYFKDILKFIIFLALGLFFVWISIKDLTAEQRSTIWQNIYNVFLDNKWIYLVFCALICIISVYFRAFRSILMLKPLGHHVSLKNSYHAIMICYLANLAFPRLGEILRCTILQTHEKVPFQKSLGTVVAERIIDVIICGLMFFIAFFFEYNKLTTIFIENHVADKLIFIFEGNGKYIALAILIAIGLILFFLRKKILQFSIVQKIKNILLGFWSGLLSVKDVKKPFLFIFYSIGIWICYYFMFYVCSFAFPDFVALGSQALLASLTCVVIGTVGFVVAQGGLGAYPLLVAMVLGLYGISPEIGLAIGWVIWTTETITYLVCGLVSLLLISIEKRK